ncbi:hypothetical protein J6590_025299 [Homalodisca vitripennis]|nr:hypothetical protein J6590_103457 [Homalodisca vitripennis]KAG8287961.1 hypothetical protein J6590_025299 [Homalodisca vitripennis]
MLTEEACKKRWRDIRDHYFKLKRKQKKTDSPIVTRWPIFEKLSFLDNARRYKRYVLIVIIVTYKTNVNIFANAQPNLM